MHFKYISFFLCMKYSSNIQDHFTALLTSCCFHPLQRQLHHWWRVDDRIVADQQQTKTAGPETENGRIRTGHERWKCKQLSVINFYSIRAWNVLNVLLINPQEMKSHFCASILSTLLFSFVNKTGIGCKPRWRVLKWSKRPMPWKCNLWLDTKTASFLLCFCLIYSLNL